MSPLTVTSGLQITLDNKSTKFGPSVLSRGFGHISQLPVFLLPPEKFMSRNRSLDFAAEAGEGRRPIWPQLYRGILPGGPILGPLMGLDGASRPGPLHFNLAQVLHS